MYYAHRVYALSEDEFGCKHIINHVYTDNLFWKSVGRRKTAYYMYEMGIDVNYLKMNISKRQQRVQAMPSLLLKNIVITRSKYVWPLAITDISIKHGCL